jgi:hypothetical protein
MIVWMGVSPLTKAEAAKILKAACQSVISNSLADEGGTLLPNGPLLRHLREALDDFEKVDAGAAVPKYREHGWHDRL